MTDDRIELSEESNLNIEGKPNAPLCPMCTEVLVNAGKNYHYSKSEPDTRWFLCPDCDCHYGYHRMKGVWKVSPHDLDVNDKVRGYYGLPSVEETKELEKLG